MEPRVELQGGELLCVKSTLGQISADTTNKRVTAIVSTENVDSDGDIIRQGKNKNGAGWLLDRFNKMPVILWQHNAAIPNLSGPKTRAKVGREDGLGRVLRLDPLTLDDGDEYAQHLQGKMDRQVIRETSVGFIGKVFEPIQEGDRMTGYEFFEQELLEVSLVNRGANFDTDTAVKGLFGSRYVSEKAEDEGIPEIIELKELIADLESKISILENSVKRVGDLILAGHSGEDVLDKTLKYEAEMDEATAALYEALKKAGTVHY